MKIILLCFATILVSSCVRTHSTKEIQVHKDPNGKIIKTVQVEKAEQTGWMMPFSYEYLKCNKNDKEVPTIIH